VNLQTHDDSDILGSFYKEAEEEFNSSKKNSRRFDSKYSISKTKNYFVVHNEEKIVFIQKFKESNSVLELGARKKHTEEKEFFYTIWYFDGSRHAFSFILYVLVGIYGRVC